MQQKPKIASVTNKQPLTDSEAIRSEVVDLLELARRTAAQKLNAVMTATYWEIGRRIVESEQGGEARAEYFDLTFLTECFPLPWSHYVLLVRRTRSDEARNFYQAEALRGGWTVRQLKRQISSQFDERVALSKDKAAMLQKGEKPRSSDAVTPEEEIKDPFVLEFLGLKDEYSESDLEEALISELESFLLELGGDFAFIGRQRRLRIGQEWYRVDLICFHRRLRCLVVIDLKLGGRRRVTVTVTARPPSVYPRRRRSDAPVSQLRPRALDASS